MDAQAVCPDAQIVLGALQDLKLKDMMGECGAYTCAHRRKGQRATDHNKAAGLRHCTATNGRYGSAISQAGVVLQRMRATASP
jgi:hypothetical protein